MSDDARTVLDDGFTSFIDGDGDPGFRVKTGQEHLDALAAANLAVVSEGHAYIDGRLYRVEDTFETVWGERLAYLVPAGNTDE